MPLEVCFTHPFEQQLPMAIEPGTIQYLRYQNSFLQGRARSKDCVVVFWPSGFVQTMSAQTWDNREFLRDPSRAHLLTAAEAETAQAFFARER